LDIRGKEQQAHDLRNSGTAHVRHSSRMSHTGANRGVRKVSITGSHYLVLLATTFMWHVYICERNGQLYTGITTQLARGMRQHGAELLYSEVHSDRHQAARRAWCPEHS